MPENTCVCETHQVHCTALWSNVWYFEINL